MANAKPEARDDELLCLGEQFQKIDRNRQRAVTDKALNSLTDQWWDIAEQITEIRPETDAGFRVTARALRALARDCGDHNGLLERCAQTLVGGLRRRAI